MTRPLTRIAAAVVLHAGRVLVQRRPAGSSWAGWWEFPGGKLEAGEDEAACAVRECREELGLGVRPLATLHQAEWDAPHARVHVTFLECRLDEPEQAGPPRPREGQEARWADAAALGRLRFLPANGPLVAALCRRLAGLSSS